MQEICSAVQFIFVKAGGWCCWFLGGFDNPLRALAVLTAAGELTGVVCGLKDHALSLKFLTDLVCKMTLIFTMVGVANILDIWIFSEGRILRSTTLLFYISNEGIFLMKNAERLGIPIPDPLRQAIKRLPDNRKNNSDEVRPGSSGADFTETDEMEARTRETDAGGTGGVP